MGDICKVAIDNEDKLFKMFGINAEILIDHAWGVEPCTIKDIKNYKPISSSLSTNQVLHEPYNKQEARIIVREMVYNLVLDMTQKNAKTNMIGLYIGYDIDNIKNGYTGTIKKDYYGRGVPKESTGRVNLDTFTSSNKIIEEKVVTLFNKLANDKLLIRRIGLSFANLTDISKLTKSNIQLDLFSNKEINMMEEVKEIDLEKSVINIKKKYGKNSLLRGIDLLDKATTRDRNNQIGGHHA